LLLTKEKYEYTACDRAAVEGNLEALMSLWIWDKEAKQHTDELLLVTNE